MGNETSITNHLKSSQSVSSDKRKIRNDKLLNKRSKSVLTEQNRTDSSESDSGIVSYTKNGLRKKISNNLFIKKKNSISTILSSNMEHISSDESNQVQKLSSNHLSVPTMNEHYISNNRKSSYSDGMATLNVTNSAANRRRSRSLCAQQLKNDCQVMAQQNAQNNSTTSSNNNFSSNRRTSNGTLSPLTRLRIQQSYKNAKKTMGHSILKRACTLRSDIKLFISCLSEKKVEEIATDIYNFITESVNNIEDSDKISEISFNFGGMYAQLCNFGFRPEFFSTIADAAIAECVRLDGGAHKRCETLLAWSQLMAVMFSSVRDGYYAQIRAQRRSSLPQHRQFISQGSTDVRDPSFDNDS